MKHGHSEVNPHDKDELKRLGQIAAGGTTGAGAAALGAALLEQLVDVNILRESAISGAVIGAIAVYRSTR